ncbi:hypothetical protein H4S06_002381 [Coemansia sp. BCRC 34490]|nr:hypothetical protein H4S06_002381 [Coemansia sp. BCRC 34490]
MSDRPRTRSGSASAAAPDPHDQSMFQTAMDLPSPRPPIGRVARPRSTLAPAPVPPAPAAPITPTPASRWLDIAKGLPQFDGEDDLMLPTWMNVIRDAFPSSDPELRAMRVRAARYLITGQARERMKRTMTMEWDKFAEKLMEEFNQDLALYRVLHELKAKQRYKGLSYQAAFSKASADFENLCNMRSDSSCSVEQDISESLCAIFPEKIIRETGLQRRLVKRFKDTFHTLYEVFTSDYIATTDGSKWSKEGLNQAYAALPPAASPTTQAPASPPTQLQHSSAKKKRKGKSKKGTESNKNTTQHKAFHSDASPDDADSVTESPPAMEVSELLDVLQRFYNSRNTARHF